MSRLLSNEFWGLPEKVIIIQLLLLSKTTLLVIDILPYMLNCYQVSMEGKYIYTISFSAQHIKKWYFLTGWLLFTICWQCLFNWRELCPLFDFMEDVISVEYILPRYFYVSLAGLTSCKIDGTAFCLSFAVNRMRCYVLSVLLSSTSAIAVLVLSDQTTYHNRGTVTSGEDNNKTIASGKQLSVYPEFP